MNPNMQDINLEEGVCSTQRFCYLKFGLQPSHDRDSLREWWGVAWTDLYFGEITTGATGA